MILRIFKLMLLFCFLLSTTCKNNNPVNSTEAEQKSYYLYVGNQTDHEVYIVDTASNVVVDTLRWFSGDVWDVTPTNNGEKLYVITRGSSRSGPGKVCSVDLQTRTPSVIWDDIAADVFTAPNGKIFIIAYVPRSDDAYLGTIDPFTDTIAFFDTLDIRNTLSNHQAVVFDPNGPLMYTVNNDDRLFAYDYDKKEVVRTYENIYIPRRMAISPDGKYLYVAGGPVVDLENGEAIAGVGGNVLGSLALSPDGELLYITDPGKYFHGLSNPSGKVFVYNTRTHQYVGEIDVLKKLPSGRSRRTDWIALMPDGQTAYVCNFGRLIFIIDLQVREVREIIEFPPFIVLIALGIKP
ncbi:MAG: YncE family protein [bacterium]